MNGRRYLLVLPRMQGFFSLVFQVLGQAYLADRAKLTPVVYFNQHCPYWSEAGYGEVRNVWEYYFEPLSDSRVEDLFPVSRDVLESASCDDFVRMSAGTPVAVTDRHPDVVEYWSPIGVSLQRRFVHGLISKYLRLKPAIRQKLEDFCEANFSSQPIAGVHYRGIEKTQGVVKDGSVSPRSRDMKVLYLQEVERFLHKHPTGKVFIATDSQEFLDLARSRFGEAIFCQDVARLQKNEEVVGLHFSDKAKANGPLLGEEVLLDVLILARTQFFIHGISNVASAVLFFNPQLRQTDIDFRYGNTGAYLIREVRRILSGGGALRRLMLPLPR